MKASVLCVGTEMTDGQILNKNSAWISARLKDLGLLTSLHLVVPDDRKLIAQGLELCALHADLVFVTGGLGPTSDDFTRELVTEWAQRPLVFHQASWNHLEERLHSRGYVVKSIQRQQCYFPEGAEVLFNPQGTANAFYLQSQGKDVFVLPGPPREIEAVWNHSIANWLQGKTKNLDPHITRKWDTMGVGESDIASIIEEVVAGLDIEVGYRVHLPYVEVKISYYQSRAEEFQTLVEKITEALSQCLVTRDGEDLAESFAKKVSTFSAFTLVDQVSGSFLTNRLLAPLRQQMAQQKWTLTNTSLKDTADLHLEILPQGELACEVSFEFRGRKVRDGITAPYHAANMKERRLQFFAEKALVFWLRHL